MKGGEQVRKAANDVASDNGAEAAAHAEATIDQVRDLLFGGAQRSLEKRLASLSEETQASLKQLQAEFAKELAALQAKLQELERNTEQQRLASIRDIGAAISGLGEAISGLGSGRSGT
jgi:hypothetical protein